MFYLVTDLLRRADIAIIQVGWLVGWLVSITVLVIDRRHKIILLCILQFKKSGMNLDHQLCDSKQ